MELFRQQGLRFTMQQVAEPLHISKKTIYTVYPSKEELLLSMVDAAFEEIHRCKQKILESDGLLLEKLRAVIIAMPEEYSALDLQQMKELEAERNELQETAAKYAEVRLWLDTFIEQTMQSDTLTTVDGTTMKMLVDRIHVRNDGIVVEFKCGVAIEQEYVK